VLACAAILGSLAVPGAEAQKVVSPGVFSILPSLGEIQIRNLLLDLTQRPSPQCSDGLDNDLDGKTDVVDLGCQPGSAGEPATDDDSELAGLFQAKENVSLSGTIDAQGNVVVPKAQILLPTTYVSLKNPLNNSYAVVTVKTKATHDATGVLDPLTGDTNLRVRFKVQVVGAPFGLSLGLFCAIGTDAAPIDINVLTSGRGTGAGEVMEGVPYSPTTGLVTVVNNSFAVPGATGCPWAPGLDINALINTQMGLPSSSGNNHATLTGVISPKVGSAISPAMVITPALSNLSVGYVPADLTFDASSSFVLKTPATYSWEFFLDGASVGTASGPVAVRSLSTSGRYVARLTVTDADGDAARFDKVFWMLSGGGTTTTTQPTTTTTSTTTTTQPTTTTTAKPTTTTSTTTTTQPTTTTTAKPTTTTSTTTTTQPTTTTTAKPTTTTTTTQPTTTTTAKPTTTTSTSTTTTVSIPVAGADLVSVRLSGARDYEVEGELLSGDFEVRQRGDTLLGVVGAGTVETASAVSATAGAPTPAPPRVAVKVGRLWGLSFYLGEVTVYDPDARIWLTVPYAGRPEVVGTTVSGSTDWYLLGRFPKLLQPMRLEWSITDR
jgi:hypothetical protein